MQLPKILAPWASALNMFPDDMALTIGQLMHRVSLILGPLREGFIEGQEEPDGYEGITTKGPYERLLLSDWMMAETVPEEFFRRATMNEHQFYKLKTLASKGTYRTVVLFDSGPLQLGMPRVMHLVLMLLLQQRAGLSQAFFSWGVLQHPDDGLFELSNENDVKRLLASRANTLVSDEMTTKWQQELAVGDTIGELWIVGDGSFAQNFSGAKSLGITETPSMEGHKLSVHCQVKSTSRKATFNMPDQDILTRLIRNPFQLPVSNATTAARDLANGNAIIFSDNGRKLAVKLNGGGVAVYSIPNSPRENVGKAKYFDPPIDQSVVAVSIKRRRMMVITCDGGKFFFYRFPDASHNYASKGMESAQHIPLSETDEDILPFVYDETEGVHSIWILDGKKNLRRMQWLPKSSLFKTEYKQVMAWARTGHSLNVVAFDAENRKAVLREDITSKKEKPIEEFTNVKPSSEAFFYNTQVWQSHQKGIVAIPLETGKWKIVGIKSTMDLDVDSGYEVVGVMLMRCESEHVSGGKKQEENTSCLVTLNKARTHFNLVSAQGNKTIKAMGEVRSVNVCQTQPYIGYRTVSNELCVYAVNHNAHVMHVLSGGGS